MALRYIFLGDDPNRFEVLTDGVIALNDAGIKVYPDAFHITELRDLTETDVANGIDFTILEQTRRNIIATGEDHGYTITEFDNDNQEAVRHTAVRITTYSPARGGTTSSLTQNIILTFSENVAKSTETGPTVKLLNLTDNDVIETFAFDSTAITVATNQATINPTASLTDGDEYGLLISTGYFTNSGGTVNHGGIHVNNFYMFTAGS